MASQYSILRQYAPYVSPYNIDLVKDVMMYKQQKVAAAREKIYPRVKRYISLKPALIWKIRCQV